MKVNITLQIRVDVAKTMAAVALLLKVIAPLLGL